MKKIILHIRLAILLTALGVGQIVFGQTSSAELRTAERISNTSTGWEKFGTATHILQAENYKHYIDQFNADDEESIKQFYPNAEAWNFLKDNMPLLDYPDKDIERTYYFRWWTFRKHIKQTPDGFVVTEFLPNVPWAGKHNAISCPAGHHFREGRWLRNSAFLDDYGIFWLQKGGAVRNYSFWIANSLLQKALVCGDWTIAKQLLPDLIMNYEAWEKERLAPNGLFWQWDGQDGGEFSATGAFFDTKGGRPFSHAGYRPTINSYMFAEATAIAYLSGLLDKQEIQKTFTDKANKIRDLQNVNLWDDAAKFYKVADKEQDPNAPLRLSRVREEFGYTPWYFENYQPPLERAVAFKQLLDPKGFYAPFGPTTAEQRDPLFRIAYTGHECQWDGPSWPFATSITLTALANEINREPNNHYKLKETFLTTLQCYTNSHQRKRDDGKVVPWIDENLNPFTGDWIARTRLKSWKNGTWDEGKGGYERGKDYNHSTYCDIIINGLIGLRPQPNNSMVVFPLVPDDMEYFCLDGVNYHGKTITIMYDKTGKRYRRAGSSFKVFTLLIDGKTAYTADELPKEPIKIVI